MTNSSQEDEHYLDTMKAPPLYITWTKQNKGKQDAKSKQRKKKHVEKTTERQQGCKTNGASFQHIPTSVHNSTLFLLTETKHRGNKRTRGETEQSGKAFFQLSLGKSDQEGAIECVRVWERKKEGNRDRGAGGGSQWVGGLATHNRPRHECSSTFVSTHPLQFQLSNRTRDSPHPLTLCTKKACAHTEAG